MKFPRKQRQSCCIIVILFVFSDVLLQPQYLSMKLRSILAGTRGNSSKFQRKEHSLMTEFLSAVTDTVNALILYTLVRAVCNANLLIGIMKKWCSLAWTSLITHGTEQSVSFYYNVIVILIWHFVNKYPEHNFVMLYEKK